MERYSRQNELCHFGVPGMRWGVRKERSKARTMVRHVGASAKNLKEKAKSQDEAFSKFNRDHDSMEKAMKKTVMPWNRQKRREAVEVETAKVKKSAEQLAKKRSETLRAERAYDRDAAKLEKYMSDMRKKYGKEKVKDIPYKTVELGEHQTKVMIKTGLTVNNLPVFGNWYSTRYNAKTDYADRLALIDEAARKQY